MGILLKLTILYVLGAATKIATVNCDCWDTGCQPNSWAITGCEQYNRRETGKRLCHEGNIYTCCTLGSPSDSNANKQNELSGTSTIQGIPTDKNICWVTGCQLRTWKVTGCAQFNRVESERRACNGGLMYTCCEIGSNLRQSLKNKSLLERLRIIQGYKNDENVFLQEAKIILPRQRNNGSPLDIVRVELETKLVNDFGGYTRSDVSGGWISQGGQIYHEPGWSFEIGMIDNEMTRTKLTSIARWLRGTAAQEAIYIRDPHGVVTLV